MNTRSQSTQGQLTITPPSSEESLARIAASLKELVQVQRDTMASISGLFDMADLASEMLRVNWLEGSGYAHNESDKRLLVKRLSAGDDREFNRTLDKQPPPSRPA